MGFFEKLKAGLSKTKEGFASTVDTVFSLGRKIDEDLYEELEEALIQGDVGVETALLLVDKLRARVKEDHIKEAEQLRPVLQEEISKILTTGESGFAMKKGELNIILMVGVNGVGKTTTIGKLANYFLSENNKVLLAAADTFRAAAIDQLMVWGERVGVDVIHHQEGSDPAAVVFDAMKAAIARKTDVLIIDTAGRLQNKANLMAELEKMGRIISREAPDIQPEVLLVLDATTGQNAISQAKIFGEAVPLTGLILTKLDGTAKGGVVIGIKNELNLPVRMIGVGEGIDDLREFVPEDFARALFE